MMLTTPHKRFVWARPDRYSDFSLFRDMLNRRQRPLRRAARDKQAKEANGHWKPAPWTPWLWMK